MLRSYDKNIAGRLIFCAQSCLCVSFLSFCRLAVRRRDAFAGHTFGFCWWCVFIGENLCQKTKKQKKREEKQTNRENCRSALSVSGPMCWKKITHVDVRKIIFGYTLERQAHSGIVRVVCRLPLIIRDLITLAFSSWLRFVTSCRMQSDPTTAGNRCAATSIPIETDRSSTQSSYGGIARPIVFRLRNINWFERRNGTHETGSECCSQQWQCPMTSRKRRIAIAATALQFSSMKTNWRGKMHTWYSSSNGQRMCLSIGYTFAMRIVCTTIRLYVSS